MNRCLLVTITVLLCVACVMAQNAPDKLVFKGDEATIDSLKRTDYPYLFPIWGDKVRKMGVTLPLPAGLGVNYLWQESDLAITDLKIGFNGGPMMDLSEIVRFNSAVAKANAINMRPDLWILPFLNVYAIVAIAKTSTTIGAGLWLPDSTNTWHEVTAFSSEAKFDAQTFGFGVTPTFGVAGGWVALDMNFAWSDVSALEKPAFSFVFGPRIGKTFKFEDPQMTFAVWVGGFRLNLGSETSGSLNLAEVLPIDGLQGKVDQGMANVAATQQKVDNWWNGLTQREQQNPVNQARYETANRALAQAGELLTGLDGALSNVESATVQYSLEKAQKKMWNFIVGAQFQLNESWMIRAEYGFRGTRQQFIGGLQYRFGL
jgi:hypothetical protein